MPEIAPLIVRGNVKSDSARMRAWASALLVRECASSMRAVFNAAIVAIGGGSVPTGCVPCAPRGGVLPGVPRYAPQSLWESPPIARKSVCDVLVLTRAARTGSAFKLCTALLSCDARCALSADMRS